MPTISFPMTVNHNGDDIELDATWNITVETFPAETYSWGGSRGHDTEVTARLSDWDGGRPRSDAVRLYGPRFVSRFEDFVAAAYDPEDV